MQPSIFTRIIRGEMPSHKIYEDEKAIAILSIYPSVPGHVLVIPKIQVDRLHDLPDDDYTHLMVVLKKVMTRMADVFGPDYRICLKVAGFDIPHVHIHVVPCKAGKEFKLFEDTSKEPDHTALAEQAKKLAF